MKNQIFKSEAFGEIRVAGTSENPMFCLADICRVLELRVDGVIPRLREGGYNRIVVTDSLGRKQNTYFVNEQNLYKVIMRSDKPQAEPFQDWVYGEVLPSIRKHGGYMVSKENETTEELMARALVIAQETLKRKEQRLLEAESKIKEDAPKVKFYDAVTGSKDAIDMRLVATMLNIGVGRNIIFEILRNEKILDRKNIPYQKYIDMGYFRTVETSYSKPSGDTCINIKTVVFQKGINFIRNTITKRIKE